MNMSVWTNWPIRPPKFLSQAYGETDQMWVFLLLFLQSYVHSDAIIAFAQIYELVYLSRVKNISPISKYFVRANGWGISKLVITKWVP